MLRNLRPVLFGSVALLLSCGDPNSASPPVAPTQAGHRTPISAVTPARVAVDLGAVSISNDERGVPRMLRGTEAGPAIVAATATATAVGHVSRLAPAWGVAGTALPALEGRGEIAFGGGTIVRLGQVIDGLAIHPSAGGELRVMVRKDGTMVLASGKLFSTAMPRGAATFADPSDADAVARAVRALYKGKPFAASSLAATPAAAGGRFLGGATGTVHVAMARAQKALWPEAKQLTPAWIVEMYSSDGDTTDGDAYRTVIAADGRVLQQTDLKADVAFKYRVFAEPTGEFHPFDGPIVDAVPNTTGAPSTIPFPNTPYPAFATTNLVSVEGTNHPAGRPGPDPWLRVGATQTVGNNVEAYTDVNAPDGLTVGDFRAQITAQGTFDRTPDLEHGALASIDQQMAGITGLFYILNWMHDFWYDGGFTEAAGNGQNSNLGRGGVEGDAMLGEAQDNALGGSRNNANMSTPGDGFPGRMQVFIWDNKDLERSLHVGELSPVTAPAVFAPLAFTASADLVLADDGVGQATDACSPLPASVAGKIVLVDRLPDPLVAACTPKFKALQVQNAGGAGMIVAHTAGIAIPPNLGNDATITTAITIPVLSVTFADGAAIKAALTAGPQTAALKRTAAPDLEGTYDASVLAHEFGHFLHHRLSNCNTSLCGAMSEGWGDFSALLVIARPEDRELGHLDAAYQMGVFSTRARLADPTYFGIRRAPYSTDMAINGFTYGHIKQGLALPTTFPINNGNPANNNEVHNAGEVWANTMWEGYVALQKLGALRGRSFDAVRLEMRKLIVAGLLLSPTDSTPTEMRDAILAAALASDPEEHATLAQAYAKRGMGSCAISPERNSVPFAGITESFDVKGRLDAGVISLAQDHSCDSDAVLDAGETGKVTVRLANGGAAALANVSVTLSSTVPGVHITAPTQMVGALGIAASTELTFAVSLDSSVTDVVAGDFTATLVTTNGCANLTSATLAVPLNSDDKANASATDSFDALGTVWESSTTPNLFSHVRPSALDGAIHAIDDGSAATEATFTSPLLAAGAGPVTLSLRHKFSFEGSVAQPFDGGVIEFSTDSNFAVWRDITEIAAASPYNVTLLATGTNPLRGRKAFGAASPDFATGVFQSLTIDLGTALANQMFKIRFRVGSDANTGAPGWDIDDVALTGITGTPFPALIADQGVCEVAVDAAVDAPIDAAPPPIDGTPAVDAYVPPPHDAYVPPADAYNPGNGGGGGCQTTGGAGGVALALGALGLLRRRRRA